jgi:nucleotide-binding universal stress UspA family protein
MSEAAMYRTILLAYDGTREGRLALREGALLAKHFRSEVVLLAVVEASFVPIAVDAGVAYVPNDQSAECQQVLHEGSVRLTTLGLEHRVNLQVGDPVSCIVNAAKEANADLVVVGHHKSGWLARWLHESVIASLIESLDCSVLSAHMEVSDDDLFGPTT